MESWELVIIGAGAAGLAAGIYGARSGLKTLIVDEKFAGGTTADAPVVENYPGFSHIAGNELAEKMVDHCKKVGGLKLGNLPKEEWRELNNNQLIVY